MGGGGEKRGFWETGDRGACKRNKAGVHLRMRPWALGLELR